MKLNKKGKIGLLQYKRTLITMNFYLLKSTREIAERDVVLNRDHISIMIAAKVTSKFNDFYALKIFMTDGQNVPAEFNKEEEQCSIELKRPEKTIN